MAEVYTSDDVITVLKKKGFYIHHQRGSHMTMKRDIPKRRVTIPRHSVIAKGTFSSISGRLELL